MIERHDPGSERRLTLAADKGYDTRGFIAECRRMCVTPHIAAKVRHSAIDRRTTRHAAYAASQRRRKQIEEAFGWAKSIAGKKKDGFVEINTKHPPAVRRQLKRLAMNLDKSQQELVAAALNMLFRHYQRPDIA